MWGEGDSEQGQRMGYHGGRGLEGFGSGAAEGKGYHVLQRAELGSWS